MTQSAALHFKRYTFISCFSFLCLLYCLKPPLSAQMRHGPPTPQRAKQRGGNFTSPFKHPLDGHPAFQIKAYLQPAVWEGTACLSLLKGPGRGFNFWAAAPWASSSNQRPHHSYPPTIYIAHLIHCTFTGTDTHIGSTSPGQGISTSSARGRRGTQVSRHVFPSSLPLAPPPTLTTPHRSIAPSILPSTPSSLPDDGPRSIIQKASTTHIIMLDRRRRHGRGRPPPALHLLLVLLLGCCLGGGHALLLPFPTLVPVPIAASSHYNRNGRETVAAAPLFSHPSHVSSPPASLSSPPPPRSPPPPPGKRDKMAPLVRTHECIYVGVMRNLF